MGTSLEAAVYDCSKPGSLRKAREDLLILGLMSVGIASAHERYASHRQRVAPKCSILMMQHLNNGALKVRKKRNVLVLCAMLMLQSGSRCNLQRNILDFSFPVLQSGLRSRFHTPPFRPLFNAAMRKGAP